MQTTKEAREQEDHMRREFANMKTKISGDLVESIDFIDNLKSDILVTKEESQRATSEITEALNASIAKAAGQTRLVRGVSLKCRMPYTALHRNAILPTMFCRFSLSPMTARRQERMGKLGRAIWPSSLRTIRSHLG